MEREHASKQGKKRNPPGVARVKPIALRLTNAERTAAEKLAGNEQSLSALARECYLAGCEVLYPDSNPSSQPRAKRGLARGGAAKHRAAASLSE